jgi:hypothetical protein
MSGLKLIFDRKRAVLLHIAVEEAIFPVHLVENRIILALTDRFPFGL